MSLRQQRRYLAKTVPGRAGLAALTGIGTLTATLVPQAWANSPFGSAPVEADRAIALAQPLSGDRWNLIVLEQIEPAPPCWRRFPDGSVITYENSLPAGTCGRYLSSSAYSLRVHGDDLRHPWRLKVESNGSQLQLLASGNLQAEPLLVGSGALAGSGLVELKLEDGWSFERRTYQGSNLSHLYVANAEPLPVLLARARSGGNLLAAMPPLPPPPPNPGDGPSRGRTSGSNTLADSGGSGGSDRLARLRALGWGNRSRGSQASDSEDSSGVIALQVVPYRP
jgi:hypothetical protein